MNLKLLWIYSGAFATSIILVVPVSAQKTCKATSSCSCTYDDGTGIDLSPIAQSGAAAFPDQWDASYIAQYSYNPCNDFTEGSCSGVSVCQYNGVDYYPCGTQASATFQNDPNNPSVLNLVYSQTGGDGVLRTSQVTLNCIQSGADSLDVAGESPSTTGLYIFQLNSVHCCAKKGGGGSPSGSSSGLSVGSVLVIVFFVLIISYFAFGIAFQKFVRKANGREVVPNVNIWTATPGLVKDGVLFVFKGGKHSPVYQQI